jgi:DNA polymerase III epsilon subunit-like protein
MSKMNSDFYISVDVETAGPYPGQYSLLSIGACSLDMPRRTFYVELKPINKDFTEEALEICQLSMSDLAQNGLEPEEAMEQFASWLQAVVPGGHRPVFVAFNAAFDWMFVAHYFHHYLGHNPFGYAALDVKTFYMALHGVSWMETSMRYVTPRYLGERSLSHHALQDALDQADIFQRMLDAAQGRSSDAPKSFVGKNLSQKVKEIKDE